MFSRFFGGNQTTSTKGAILDESTREIMKRNESPVANIYFKLVHKDHSG